MRDWITPTASLGLRKILLLACLFCALPLVAQNKQPPSAPKYDLQAETKLKGTVEEVRLPPKGSEKEIAYLLVKSGADTVDVYLCPQSFLAEMGVSFNKGDEISLTGSKVKQGEADLMLAREVVRGNDTVVLRDEKGNPVWSGRR
jgi:hypothetical protein